MKSKNPLIGMSVVIRSFILLVMIFGLIGFPHPAQAANYYVLDQFTTVAYNNQNGSANWSTDWTETADDGSVTTGNVLITGGQLRICNRCGVSDPDLEGIQRSVNLSTAATNAQILLSYQFSSANLGAGETMVVEIGNGTTYRILETISSSNTSGIRNWDITSDRYDNTTIRIRITAGSTATTSFVQFDNVKILAAFLDEAGWQRVSDDILPVNIGDKGLMAYPHYPQQKLAADAQPWLHLTEEIPVRTLYLLSPVKKDNPPAIAPLSTSETARALLAHTAGTRLFNSLILKEHLGFCTRSAAKVAGYRLDYPHRREALPLIEEMLEGLC